MTDQLQSGDAFPSVRTLSRELHISPTTAHKVVSQLKTDGFLVSQPGIGMVVSIPDMPSRETRMEQLIPACRALLSEAADMSLSLDDLIDVLRKTAAEDGTLTSETGR